MSKRDNSSALINVDVPRTQPEAKKAKVTAIVRSSAGSIVTVKGGRTSDLKAPIMELNGHSESVLSVCFSPGGNAFASASFDKTIMLWNTFGDCVNYDVITGHKNAVLSVKWSSCGGFLASASADRTACVWDSETCKRERIIRTHKGVVNEVDFAKNQPHLLATAGDDKLACLFDIRESTKRSTADFKTDYQLTSVCLHPDGKLLFAAGIDSKIHCWDTRKPEEELLTIEGHRDAVTGLSLSKDGSYILSTAQDNTVRVWDAKPFSNRPNRCLKIFQGSKHTFENHLLRCGWASDGSRVAAGSTDRNVYVWSTASQKILYKLPGHKGVVNDVKFHPTQPIIVSCGADKKIYLGELKDE